METVPTQRSVLFQAEKGDGVVMDQAALRSLSVEERGVVEDRQLNFVAVGPHVVLEGRNFLGAVLFGECTRRQAVLMMALVRIEGNWASRS